MLKARVLSAAAALAVCGVAAASTALAAAQAEPPVGGPGHDGDYLRLVHDRLHAAWADSYIRMSPYKEIGPDNSDRQTEVSVTIRWDGTVEKAAVSKASDSMDFDAAALNAMWSAAPFPPPVEVLADDGFAHVKWRFARNYRLCSGGELVHVEYPLQIALPNLTQRGRFGEAIRRMNEELLRTGWSGGDFVSPFARQWLSRPNLSNDLDTRAAAALALGGDRKQIRALETALLLPPTAGIAATTLQTLGQDVGGMLARALAAEAGASARPAVVAAVRAAPAVLASCAACVEVLAAAAVDPRQPVAARLEMIEVLSHVDSPLGEQVISHAAKDASPAIRGAALLAQTSPKSGRVGLIRMAALLHDPAPEIRAAAAAGVLRAGGDAGIEQLYLLGRDRDPRPSIAAAGELGRMSSEASMELLTKLLKRSDPSIRRAAIRALANRTDHGAPELVGPILAAARTNAAEDAEVRRMAMASAQPSELVGFSMDPRLGLSAYRALLRANLREEAARWLLGNIEQLSAEDRIATLGDWIATPPKYAASAQR